MALTFGCPHCHQVYRAEDADAGKTVQCRICNVKIIVPRPVVPPPVIVPSSSGAPVFKHQVPTSPPEVVSQSTPFLAQISRHIERTIGPAPMVFHEKVSTTIHVDLHVVPPTNLPPSREHPFGTSHVTVVTSGVSSKPMNVPLNYKGPKYIELMIALPPDWPGLRSDGTFDQDVMKDERNWWPFRWLKNAARLPSRFNTFLSLGHTIPNGEQANPFAGNTRLGCLMVSPPLLSPQSLKLVVNDNVSVFFLALMPIYSEEMQLKLRTGGKALNDLLDAARLTELIDVDRPNVVQKPNV